MMSGVKISGVGMVSFDASQASQINSRKEVDEMILGKPAPDADRLVSPNGIHYDCKVCEGIVVPLRLVPENSAWFDRLQYLVIDQTGPCYSTVGTNDIEVAPHQLGLSADFIDRLIALRTSLSDSPENDVTYYVMPEGDVLIDICLKDATEPLEPDEVLFEKIVSCLSGTRP